MVHRYFEHFCEAHFNHLLHTGKRFIINSNTAFCLSVLFAESVITITYWSRISALVNASHTSEKVNIKFFCYEYRFRCFVNGKIK
jgi:hypothetical protein